jgi:hypothetical protein
LLYQALRIVKKSLCLEILLKKIKKVKEKHEKKLCFNNLFHCPRRARSTKYIKRNVWLHSARYQQKTSKKVLLTIFFFLMFINITWAE